MKLAVIEQSLQVVILRPEGNIDVITAPALHERLDQWLAEGIAYFVIDLSAVPFLDSAGMVVLVSTLKRSRQRGGDVALVWPRSEPSRRILRLTRLDRVFIIADDIATAQHSMMGA